MADKNIEKNIEFVNIGGINFTEKDIPQLLNKETSFVNVDGVCYTAEDVKNVVHTALNLENQVNFLKSQLLNVLSGDVE